MFRDDPAAEMMIRHLLADADAGLQPGRVAHAILRLEREREAREATLTAGAPTNSTTDAPTNHQSEENQP